MSEYPIVSDLRRQLQVERSRYHQANDTIEKLRRQFIREIQDLKTENDSLKQKIFAKY